MAAIATATPAMGQVAPPDDEPVVGPIDGSEVPTVPLSGTINPFTGTINPFTGTINPFYGNVTPFWGTLNPFSGNIVAFWGGLNPFTGTINPFTGTINPFTGTINPFTGTINPFTGTINPFNGTINPFTGTIIAFDSDALNAVGTYWEYYGQHWHGTERLWSDPLRGLELSTKLNELITRTEALWGAAVSSQSGKSFSAAFLNPLFARYGINPSNPGTLQALTSEQRNQFFLDWYDSLMGFSGMERVDHWMRTVNWTPSVTQQQGSGADSIIGLLDATATGDPDIADNVTWSGGFNTTVLGHGVGVASLMVAAHDGTGVMGIAPQARVIAYNPFDATGTASWSAIREGVLSLSSRNASVINMSLGVPGYTLHPDWRKIFFDSSIFAATHNRVFVMAAGNDGRAQTENLRWDWNRDPNLIIVGSTRVDGVISSFSNTPGTACLLAGDSCHELLMNRFIVAPGELMLTPDGQGGFVRRTGTSFAAPLVSGAITLLHDRWPWLAGFPRESVEIILRSARDLGAPGVDPVYGRGMLDVTASQSPLDFNSLRFYEVRDGAMISRSAADIRAAGVNTTWEASGVYFYMYEPIGQTMRDFAVPVSSQLVGQVRTDAGDQYFQQFITGRLIDWINGRSSSGFTDTASVELFASPTLRVSMVGSRPEAMLMAQAGGYVPHTAVRMQLGSGFGFSAGYGNGALALNGQPGLGLSSDHGRDGGVNPLLALASGGAFADVHVSLGSNTTLSFGTTRNDDANSRLRLGSDFARTARDDLDPYEADAVNLRLNHRASSNLVLSGSYAQVRESNALLGVQSRLPADLGHGATSETATVGASLTSGRFTLAASGTVARTRSVGDPEQGFTTRGGGVLSTAFALSATRQGVLDRRDILRVSLAQPLHIESGELEYSSVEVIDRETGELGIARQIFDLNGDPRTIAGELFYARPILSGSGELGLFGQAEIRPDGSLDVNQFAAGTRISVRF